MYDECYWWNQGLLHVSLQWSASPLQRRKDQTLVRVTEPEALQQGNSARSVLKLGGRIPSEASRASAGVKEESGPVWPLFAGKHNTCLSLLALGVCCSRCPARCTCAFNSSSHPRAGPAGASPDSTGTHHRAGPGRGFGGAASEPGPAAATLTPRFRCIMYDFVA